MTDECSAMTVGWIGELDAVDTTPHDSRGERDPRYIADDNYLRTMALAAGVVQLFQLMFFLHCLVSKNGTSMGWIVAIQAASASTTRVTWVNGIGHNLLHMEEGNQILSKLFGGKDIQFCHNPTAMAHDEDLVGLSTDLLQAGTQKLGRITEEVNELVRHLKEAIQAVGKSGVVIHLAHSQGALITALAAKRLTAEEISHIECICFGGAAAITRDEFPAFRRIVNYYSVNDPLLFVVPAAAKKLQSGIFTTPSTTTTTPTNTKNNCPIQEEEEFVFLTPRSGNPALDHSLFGPTYGEVVAWEGQRFQNRYQHFIVRSSRPLLLHMQQLVITIALFLMNYIFRPIYSYIRNRLHAASHLLLNDLIEPFVKIVAFLWQLLLYYVHIWVGGGKRYEPVVKT